MSQTPKVLEAFHVWQNYPDAIEHDLEVYHNVSVGDWLTGKMSSRKFLMYLDGLLIDTRTVNGWYAKAVRIDVERQQAEAVRRAELLARAENKAQITGQPLDMADLEL